jgi:hypothetical protein
MALSETEVFGTVIPGFVTDTDGRLSVSDPIVAETGMGVVVHGSTAGTARPTTFAVITWIGTVEPSNMAVNDIWIDTTP